MCFQKLLQSQWDGSRAVFSDAADSSVFKIRALPSLVTSTEILGEEGLVGLALEAADEEAVIVADGVDS